MFRKTLLSFAAAISLTAGAAMAQYGQPQAQYTGVPEQPYVGPQQPYAPSQQPGGFCGTGGGYGANSGGYSANGGNGGYGGNGRYGANTGNGGYGGNGGIAAGGSCNYGGKLDLSSAQPRQSQAYRYMLPQGWQAVEQPGICMTVAPDMTMAVGIMAPGSTSGNVSAEQYMRTVLTNVGQFQNINVQNAQGMQPQAPFTEAGTFMISYTVMGQQYAGVINCAVAQQNGQTWGFVQVVLGTPQQLSINGRELCQLSQSMVPLNQQGAGFNGGPAPTPNPNPTPTPSPAPTPSVQPMPSPVSPNSLPPQVDPGMSPTPTPAPPPATLGDWNWGNR